MVFLRGAPAAPGPADQGASLLTMALVRGGGLVQGPSRRRFVPCAPRLQITARVPISARARARARWVHQCRIESFWVLHGALLSAAILQRKGHSFRN